MTSEIDKYMGLLSGNATAVVVKPKPPAEKPVPKSVAATPVVVEEDGIAPVPLGYNHGRYFLLSRSDRQVHEIATSTLGQNTLIAIAPLSFWLRKFKGVKGVDWSSAIDWLIGVCQDAGVYHPAKVRGRGVSFDNGRAVLHLGNHIIVDGLPQPSLTLPGSKYIYERSSSLDIELGQPLSCADASKILEICQLFSWASVDMGLLLAGWVVTAPVCGGLPWRTHIWLTGMIGSGKSWIISNFVRQLVGPLGLNVQSKTTEAGIRQHLKTDARPIIFDEAETQNSDDGGRIQHVLDLARQASSDDGADILKGTVNGRELRYRVCSSFMFSSVNFGATQAADESRIIPLNLIPIGTSAEAAARFDEIKKLVTSVITEDFCGRLLSRTLHMLPIIRANIKTFSRALSEKMGSRQADTIGCLIAGMYSLVSDGQLTVAEAAKFIENKSWIETTATRTETEADHFKAVAHLMEQIVRLTPTAEFSVAEAMKKAYLEPESEAARLLGRHGMRVKDQNLYIGRSHQAVDRFYAATPWAKRWAGTLLQYPGSFMHDKVMDFAGYKKRAIAVPLKCLPVELITQG